MSFFFQESYIEIETQASEKRIKMIGNVLSLVLGVIEMMVFANAFYGKSIRYNCTNHDLNRRIEISVLKISFCSVHFEGRASLHEGEMQCHSD